MARFTLSDLVALIELRDGFHNAVASVVNTFAFSGIVKRMKPQIRQTKGDAKRA